MTKPGAVVVCTTLDCRPHMIVLAAEGKPLRTALLADLASESIQRLACGHTESVVRAVQRAADIEIYRVPTDDVAPSPVLEGSA